jgi:hypothetical protein
LALQVSNGDWWGRIFDERKKEMDGMEEARPIRAQINAEFYVYHRRIRFLFCLALHRSHYYSNTTKKNYMVQYNPSWINNKYSKKLLFFFC